MIAPPPDLKPIPDADFMENVVEARDNGFDLLCAYCGIGIFDESDMHDRQCPLYVPWEPGT